MSFNGVHLLWACHNGVYIELDESDERYTAGVKHEVQFVLSRVVDSKRMDIIRRAITVYEYHAEASSELYINKFSEVIVAFIHI